MDLEALSSQLRDAGVRAAEEGSTSAVILAASNRTGTLRLTLESGDCIDFGPFPIEPPVVRTINTQDTTAARQAEVEAGVVRIGEYSLRPTGRRIRWTGSSTEKTSSNGFARRYVVKGPKRLHLVIGDIEWTDGTRDVRLLDVRHGPDLMNKLSDHCRLTVQSYSTKTSYVELRRATAKLLTGRTGATALETVSLVALSRSAEVSVRDLLQDVGARHVETRGVLLKRKPGVKDRLCVTFSPSQHLVPAVAYVISRSSRCTASRFRLVAPGPGRSLTGSSLQSEMDRDDPHQEERDGGHTDAPLIKHGTPVVATLMGNPEHFLLRANGTGT